uniref:PID domain-containing protein n=1 Tax=Haemonchus contortus TaxID=6289 RepID=A0A7I4Y8Z7_HAECO|nr:Protein M88.4 [Haemonchus contortus]
MSWFFPSKLAKSHFYVWYLGSKEADGVRGSAVVLPIMRQLLKDTFKKAPNKATVQISSKGLKLIQTVPAMSRKGKVKMQTVKFQIAASCITYSIIGKPPFDDVVGVIMLVLNPEMNSPMHVHCYRCDSSQTAQIMHANLQILISRPEVQRSIQDLEQRLFLAGLLIPRPLPRSTSQPKARAASDDFEHPVARSRTRIFPEEDTSKTLQKGNPRMPRQVVDELKTKLSTNDLRAMRNSIQSINLRSESSSLTSRPPPLRPYRLFGDTLLKEGKSRSLDNLADTFVSTDLRGGTHRPMHRFSRPELSDPFGSVHEDHPKVDGFWKPTVRRMSSIRMNL